MRVLLFFISLFLSSSASFVYNDGIHLAVVPKCGPLSGKTASVNAGLDPRSFKTIVAFGVRLLEH